MEPLISILTLGGVIVYHGYQCKYLALLGLFTPSDCEGKHEFYLCVLHLTESNFSRCHFRNRFNVNQP